jgi:hypothetical protein
MEWDPEVRAKLNELRELREEASLREQQRTAALRPIGQSETYWPVNGARN